MNPILQFNSFWEVLLLDTDRALIGVAAGQSIMREHDKVQVFYVYRTVRLPSINEELFTITMIDRLVELQLLVLDDPLERVLEEYKRDEDTMAQQIETCLNFES